MRSTRKNKAGIQHTPQTIITKIIAMPQYPGYKEGKKLPVGTFYVSEFVKSKGIRPTKKEWNAGLKIAIDMCQTFINSQPKGAYWMMKKGFKTSHRSVSRIPARKAS